MDEETRKRLAAFVRALDAAGYRTGGTEVACHHSAVEVNDWHSIRQAMQDTDSSLDIPSDGPGHQTANLPLTSSAVEDGSAIRGRQS